MGRHIPDGLLGRFLCSETELKEAKMVVRHLQRKQTSLSQFFRQPPLADLDLERDRSPVRPGPKLEAEEQATAEAYPRHPDDPAVAFDPADWEDQGAWGAR